MYICRIKLKQIVMKEMKFEIPAGCEVDKIETQDGHIVVTFREKERKLPKSWEEFCEMFPIKKGEVSISVVDYDIYERDCDHLTPAERDPDEDIFTFSEKSVAEAFLSLCKLIQLRNAYNGDWVPDWNKSTDKIVIDFCRDGDLLTFYAQGEVTLLAFKDKETADEFLRNFHPLIEKLKPLYGIKEGGEK